MKPASDDDGRVTRKCRYNCARLGRANVCARYPARDGVDRCKNLWFHTACATVRTCEPARIVNRKRINAAGSIGGVAQHPVDVRDGNVGVGGDRHGNGAGRRVGVDVIRVDGTLVDCDRRDDGYVAGVEQREKRRRVDGYNLADETQVAPRGRTRRPHANERAVLSAQPECRNPALQKSAHEAFVCRRAQHRLGNLERPLVGDAQPVHAVGHQAYSHERAVDLRPAAVHEDDGVPGGAESGDLEQKRGIGFASHGVSAVLEHDFHAGATRRPSLLAKLCNICINIQHMYALAPAPALHERHLLAVDDLTARELETVLRLAAYLKFRRPGEQAQVLRGKTLAMLFEKPSLRTRVSFEVAMTQLGGHVVFAQGSEFSIGTRETPEDAARVLSRYADAIVIRTHAHEPLQRFASAAGVPVINGLSAAAHPCQALADMLTLQERFGSLQGLRVAYLGDAKNNVAVSLAQAAVLCGATVHFGAPPSHRPSEEFLAQLRDLGKAQGGGARAFTSPVRAVRGVDAIYTDVWTSMGEEAATERNRAVLAPYRVTDALFAHAAPHAVFMHCLPAHRGEEASAQVVDGPRSIIFDQAENRMHAQKAVLLALLTDLKGFPV